MPTAWELMQTAYFNCYALDFKYDEQTTADVDPILRDQLLLGHNCAFATMDWTCRIAGAACVPKGEWLYVYARESTFDAMRPLYTWMQRSKHSPKMVKHLQHWAEYDDDFDLPVEIRRSTLWAGKRQHRIAKEDILWRIVWDFPELRDYAYPNEPRLLPTVAVGGILKETQHEVQSEDAQGTGAA